MKQLRKEILSNTIDGIPSACELHLYVDFIFNVPVFIVHNQLAKDFDVDDVRRYGAVFVDFYSAMNFMQLAKATWYGNTEIELGRVQGCIKYHELYELLEDKNGDDELIIEISTGNKFVFLTVGDDPNSLHFTSDISKACNFNNLGHADMIIARLGLACEMASVTEIIKTGVFNDHDVVNFSVLRKTAERTHSVVRHYTTNI
ncbi:hypothetical protein [Pseudomonas phage PA1C]|nr:hypothetical protein [Pseudomonas phage PA1C]